MNKNISDVRSKIMKGMGISLSKMIDYKKRIHSDIVVSKEGSIFHIKPDDFPR